MVRDRLLAELARAALLKVSWPLLCMRPSLKLMAPTHRRCALSARPLRPAAQARKQIVFMNAMGCQPDLGMPCGLVWHCHCLKMRCISMAALT